jgi:cytochrome c553
MPKHIVRLIFLIAILGAAILGARAIFIDKSFGIYGHYRADAVAEIAADEPIYKGAASCQSCHRERYAMWSKGIHKVVTCETCHGAGAKHPSTEPVAPAAPMDPRMHSHIAAERLDHVNLVIPTDTVKLCTLCHEKMPGRPATQRQIEVSRHAAGMQCIVCHNPYSPRLAAAAAPKGVKLGDADAGQKKAVACAGCHGAEGISANPIWPSLAGQHNGYLVSALQTYKSRARPDPLMTEQTKALSEVDIGDLAAYFTSLSCKTAPSSSPAKVTSAGKLKAKTAGCEVCHGAMGISANPAWPSLAGQQEAYLVNVLKAYQTRARQNPMMARLVKGLSDADIGQLAAYYAGLKCK